VRRSDSGLGRGRLFVELAILAALVYVGINAIPAYVENYELSDYIRQLAIQATAQRTPAAVIQQQVVVFAQDLGLPVKRENVKVAVREADVSIALDYSVPVDLKVYTWVLHFAPSAENRFL
jgi:hypothetical protein